MFTRSNTILYCYFEMKNFEGKFAYSVNVGLSYDPEDNKANLVFCSKEEAISLLCLSACNYLVDVSTFVEGDTIFLIVENNKENFDRFMNLQGYFCNSICRCDSDYCCNICDRCIKDLKKYDLTLKKVLDMSEKEFKKEMKAIRNEYESYDDGPYGGAFRSWDDFYSWKEGSGFCSLL